MSRTLFSLPPEARFWFATSSPLSPRKTLVWGGAPGFGSALFHLISSIFWSRRRRSVSKLSSRAGCTVSTKDLSEARGLWLFRVIRGGIEISQRLNAIGTVYRRLSYSPSNPSVSRTDWPPPEKVTGDGRALHPRRSSGLRFQFFGVEALSLLPQSQRNGCNLAR
jgi:hypothetical protein